MHCGAARAACRSHVSDPPVKGLRRLHHSEAFSLQPGDGVLEAAAELGWLEGFSEVIQMSNAGDGLGVVLSPTVTE
ncbi:hypothetical protein GCM10011579_068380 [Streptomyces albiflavescens]|uniref:Uncharacterized protein n=1 Tax=Streptomyces albiflavescens TaxID=1623582 RepID=A0A918D8B8_9ACTN|nr:hypothetical protein GCM10011579_068380 [Streptomyces albiflavescens]